MTCTCVRNVNRQLRSSGAQLSTLTPRNADGRATRPPRVLVRTENTNPLKRRPVIAVATHCPFCGTKYED
ncbi:MAG: hypothetical protein AB1832_01005 [Pseudomonadota bacterium]